PQDQASLIQLLVAQIPSEALIAYTTILAALTPNQSDKVWRWVFYGVAIVACAAIVTGPYFGQHKSNLPRSIWKHLPLAPIAATVIAMSIYGLTVPDSPLSAVVTTDTFRTLSVVLAVIGGLFMYIFAQFLRTGNDTPAPDASGESS